MTRSHRPKRKPRLQITIPDPAQSIMPGVQPVGLAERLAWFADQPLQPRCGQRPLDIGFWDPMREQLDLF